MPAPALSLKLIGDREMQQKLQAAANRIPGTVATALRTEAELIMTESKRKYVPVDLGTLRSSGRVHPVQFRGIDMSIKLTFGDASAPYALAVHEHPSPASPRSWKGKSISDIRAVSSPHRPWNVAEGRGPKYLERPLKRAIRSGLLARLAERILKVFPR